MGDGAGRVGANMPAMPEASDAAMTSDLFGGPTVNDVRLADQIACVEREITLRERVYPRWVETGRMTEAQAEREILSMRAVLETLQGVHSHQETMIAENRIRANRGPRP